MKHWTRDDIATRLAACNEPMAGLAALGQIVDETIAERDDLETRVETLTAEVESLRAKAAPQVSYRLPDWLGGHLVDDVEHDIITGEARARIVAASVPGGTVVTLPHAALVEVRPPSIDDEVTLPLIVADSYRDAIEISAHLDDETPVLVQRVKNGSELGSPVHLTAEQARDAARALWLLARGGA